MKVGDHLICKKNYYTYNEIRIFGYRIVNNCFRKPFFKKNEKYRIDDIYTIDTSPFPTGTTMNNYSQPAPELHNTYRIKNKYYHEGFIPKWFYDIKSIRNEKLNKINKLWK